MNAPSIHFIADDILRLRDEYDRQYALQFELGKALEKYQLSKRTAEDGNDLGIAVRDYFAGIRE